MADVRCVFAVGGGVGGSTTAVSVAQCGVEVGFDRFSRFARRSYGCCRHRM